MKIKWKWKLKKKENENEMKMKKKTKWKWNRTTNKIKNNNENENKGWTQSGAGGWGRVPAQSWAPAAAEGARALVLSAESSVSAAPVTTWAGHLCCGRPGARGQPRLCRDGGVSTPGGTNLCARPSTSHRHCTSCPCRAMPCRATALGDAPAHRGFLHHPTASPVATSVGFISSSPQAGQLHHGSTWRPWPSHLPAWSPGSRRAPETRVIRAPTPTAVWPTVTIWDLPRFYLSHRRLRDGTNPWDMGTLNPPAVPWVAGWQCPLPPDSGQAPVILVPLPNQIPSPASWHQLWRRADAQARDWRGAPTTPTHFGGK